MVISQAKRIGDKPGELVISEAALDGAYGRAKWPYKRNVREMHFRLLPMRFDTRGFRKQRRLSAPFLERVVEY